MLERGPASSSPEAQKLLDDPAWVPRAYDPRRDWLDFFHTPREKQRAAVFLEPRFLAGVSQAGPVPVRDFAGSDVRRAAGPLHFVFHTSYCCSTVLARALDVPGVSFGLKEPSVLMSFAELWGTARQYPGALHALATVLDLLSRPLSAGETHIIKPSNACNPFIPHMLYARPDAKAVLLMSDLQSFLAAIARRGPTGRTMVRRVLYAFSATIPLDDALIKDQTLLFDDLQSATMVWLMQIACFDAVARRFGSERVRILNSDTLLARPQQSMAAVAAFFGLKEADWAAVAAGPAFREHSKNIGIPFNAADQARQRSETQSAYAAEIDAALQWSTAVAGRFNTPSTLQEDLLR